MQIFGDQIKVRIKKKYLCRKLFSELTYELRINFGVEKFHRSQYIENLQRISTDTWIKW